LLVLPPSHGPPLPCLSDHLTSPLVISPHHTASCARFWRQLNVDPPTVAFATTTPLVLSSRPSPSLSRPAFPHRLARPLSLSCPALSHRLAPPSLVLSPAPPLTLPGSPRPASPWSSPPSSWSPCQLFSFPAPPRPSLSFLPSPSLVPSPHPCLAFHLTPAWPALPSPLPSPSLVRLAQPPRHLSPHFPWFISPRLTLVLLSLILSPSLVGPAPPWSSCSAPPLR
jgi:hypothetical protein